MLKSIMKSFLLVIFVCASFSHTNALKCFTCVSNSTNKTCFTPLDKSKVPLYTCNKTTSSFNQFLNATHLNPYYVEEMLNATEYECVTYTKYIMHGPENVTEFGRGCFPKTHYVNTCQALYMVAGENRYHLNACNVCHQDNCNSASSLLPSGFLFLCFLVLRVCLK